METTRPCPYCAPTESHPDLLTVLTERYPEHPGSSPVTGATLHIQSFDHSAELLLSDGQCQTYRVINVCPVCGQDLPINIRPYGGESTC